MATNISTDTVTTNNVVVTPQVNKPGSPTEGQIISGTCLLYTSDAADE